MRARSIIEFNYDINDNTMTIKTKFINYKFKEMNVVLMCEDINGFSNFTGNAEVYFNVNFKSKILIIKNIGMTMDILNMDTKTFNFFSTI